MSILFTEYLLPDGRQKPVFLERPYDIESLANELSKECGARFEMEVLTTGHVSLTCEIDKVDEPIAIEVTNMHDIYDATDRLIEEAHRFCVETGLLPRYVVAE